jgi:hypothetical protein
VADLAQALPFAIACAFAAGVAAGTQSAWANEPPVPSTLTVHLTVDRDLPKLTTTTLVSEVETIWQAQSVTVEWRSAVEAVTNSAVLRIMVISDRALLDSADIAREHELRLGRLLRPPGGDSLAIVSIAAAAAIADRARDPQLPRTSPIEDRRLGLVLGRAVAHEIGHFLLDSAAHATRGLMRAIIAAREFGDLRPGSLALDPTDKNWPRNREFAGASRRR